MESTHIALPIDREVIGPNASDALLFARRRLRAAGYAELRQVSCEAHGKVIRLQGRVSRYHLKQLAQHLVRDLPAFDRVENRITVSEYYRTAS
jgi:hypothetical protein